MKKITAIIIGVLLPAACFAMNAAGQKSAKNLIMTAVINEIKKEAPKNAAISVEFEKPQLINVFDGAVSITAGPGGACPGKCVFIFRDMSTVKRWIHIYRFLCGRFARL